jgi:hypothetical protein
MELVTSGGFSNFIGRNCFNLSEREDRLYVNEAASADGVDNTYFFAGHISRCYCSRGCFIKAFLAKETP